MKASLWLEEEDEDGAVKSIPSSSSVYDLLTLPSLLCFQQLAVKERGWQSRHSQQQQISMLTS